MRSSLQHIIGRQIAAVVVAQGDRDSSQQVFLVFADGTRFEFRGESFSCCTGLDSAQGIEPYVESGAGKIVRVYGDVCALAPPNKSRVLARHDDAPVLRSLAKGLERDLAAWWESCAVIEKAMGA